MPASPPQSSVVLRRINATPAASPSASGPYQQEPSCPVDVPDVVSQHHTYAVGPNQCCSAAVQHVHAPASTVWSIVRRFDVPQVYKHFVKSCRVVHGDGNVGTLREIHVISGLPAGCSTERLEILDDDNHVISFSVVGGDHRLANYRSVTTLHPSPAGDGTVVVESYVVDIPPGNSREDTCVFVDTIVRCNLQSLAQLSERAITDPPAVDHI